MEVKKSLEYSESLSQAIIELEEKDKYIVDVSTLGAHSTTEIGFETFNSSQAIIDILTKHDRIFFPTGTYYMKNIQLLPGKEVCFAPDVTLKLPDPQVNDRIMIIGSLDGGNIYPVNHDKMVKIIGPVTIDMEEVERSTFYNTGIMVSGATNFEIKHIYGKGFRQGFVVLLTRSYGSEYLVPENGYIEDVRMDGGWSALAIVAGKRIKVNGVHNTGFGDGVNIESDADVVTLNSLAVNNIEIRNVSVGIGVALNINAHSAYVNNIRAYGLEADGGKIFTLYADDTVKYRLTNILIDTAFGDGKAIEKYGADSPNDIEVDNLILRNVHAKNYAKNGFRINGADWTNCSAENSGESGITLAGSSSNLTKTSSFYNCKSNNNNVKNVANCSGFLPATVGRVSFYDCEAVDTRKTKLQNYGVFVGYGEVLAVNCRFSGNTKKRIGPIDRDSYDVKIYEYFMGDGVKTAFKTVSATIGIKQTTVAHNLGRIPTFVFIKPKGKAMVWESLTATNWDVFITASVSVPCDIVIG